MTARGSITVIAIMHMAMLYTGYKIWWFADGSEFEMGPVIP